MNSTREVQTIQLLTREYEIVNSLGSRSLSKWGAASFRDIYAEKTQISEQDTLLNVECLF